MGRIGKIILMSLLLAVNSCEKVVTEIQKETVTVTDTVTVTETIVEKDTVQTTGPVPSLPAWSTSTVRIGLIGDSISTFEVGYRRAMPLIIQRLHLKSQRLLRHIGIGLFMISCRMPFWIEILLIQRQEWL